MIDYTGDKERIIKEVARYAKAFFSSDASGHDWWHTYRVWKMATRIGKAERGADMLVVQIAALLHDVVDWKLNENQKEAMGNVASLLDRLGLDKKRKRSVMYIIKNVSFKGAKVKDTMKGIDGQIVQDADRLDVLGAIGIARVFAFGGSRGRAMYDPTKKVRLHRSFSEYKKSDATSINHFHEKLFLLKGRMHTKVGKEMAKKRAAYTHEYVRRFLEEWEGRR